MKRTDTKTDITLDVMRSVLSYDPATGIFTWKEKPHKGAFAGDIAGGLHGSGYRVIGIAGHVFSAHRMAWLFVHGRWPNGMLDHRDLNRDNNAISNLREATDILNQANTKLSPRNTSGYRGIIRRKPRRLGAKEKPWAALITIRGKKRYIGVFDTPEEASAAFEKAAFAEWGDFYHGTSSSAVSSCNATGLTNAVEVEQSLRDSKIDVALVDQNNLVHE